MNLELFEKDMSTCLHCIYSHDVGTRCIKSNTHTDPYYSCSEFTMDSMTKAFIKNLAVTNHTVDKTAYISGKITGLDPKAAQKHFDKAYKKLAKEGYRVINPVNLTKSFPNGTHEEYLAICLFMMRFANVVYFLNNWQDSPGSKAEMEYARDNDMKILMERE